MKNHKITCSILIILSLLFILNGCSKKIDKNSYGYQESIINNYLHNLERKNVTDALKNVYFTKKDKESHYIDIAKDSLKSFKCKRYEIKSITKLCDNIYLANIILNTNNNSENKKLYVNEEFNPYLCFIKNRSYIVYSKSRIPNSICNDLSKIPDNYPNAKKNIIE